MNEAEPLPAGVPQKLSCLLLPLADGQLLVPVNILLEIIAMQHPTPVPGAPEWHLGELRWRKQRLPLFTFEVIRGQTTPVTSRDCRIAILRSGRVEGGEPMLFAITVQGSPRLVEVTPEELAQNESPCAPGELMHVNLSGEAAVIPDLAALEAAYREYA